MLRLLFLAAQITPPQIGIPATTSKAPVLVALADGKLVTVAIGPDLTLRKTATGYIMEKVTNLLPPSTYLKWSAMAKLPAGGYGPCPAGGLVFRNGVAQRPDQYSIDATGAIVPSEPWDDTDKIACLTIGWTPSDPR